MKIAIGVAPTVLVLGRGLWVLAAKIDNPVRGVPVREHEQPELWALVRRLAEVADTAPPNDIYWSRTRTPPSWRTPACSG